MLCARGVRVGAALPSLLHHGAARTAPAQRRCLSARVVFDRAVKRTQRDNAANHADFAKFEYLREEVADHMVSRLEMISPEFEFPLAVELGSGGGHFLRQLCVHPGIKELVQCDSAEGMLRRCREDTAAIERAGVTVHQVLCDEEHLPFAPQSVDLVVSCLALHWCNDLAGTLTQIRKALKPNGVFVGAVLGGDTLRELRTALALAEQEREGGMGMHVSPTLGAAEAGNLLTQAGFALPTVDVDTLTFQYRDMFVLARHLRGMGEGNALVQRRSFVPRDTFFAANAIYSHMFGEAHPTEKDERVLPATFQVVHMIGWAPHQSQQRPLARGSAKFSLKDIDSNAFEVKEPSDGDDNAATTKPNA